MKNIDITDRNLNWGLGLNSLRTGRNHMGSKSEVFVVINKSGLSATGSPRHSLVFRFSPEAAKKISPRSAYAQAAMDEASHRIYFREDRAGTGKKLSATSPKGSNKDLRFTINDVEKKFFQQVVGSYLLLFDTERNLYYIDWEQKLVDDYK